MTADPRSTADFEAHRAHLRGVAYRMLGSVSDAEDAVQDAWLRFSDADTSGVENMRGWLTTVVARVCLNMLRARRSRRERSFEGTLPDPIVSDPDALDPQQEALLGEAVGMAMLVVLDLAVARGARGVRAARRVRHPLRRDRPDRGPVVRSRPPAREPGATAGTRLSEPRRRSPSST